MAKKDKKDQAEEQIKEAIERLKTKEGDIWQNVRKFWFFPRIPDPIFIETTDPKDPSLSPEAKQVLEDEGGPTEFIMYTDKQTYINLPKIFKELLVKDEKELEDSVEVLELHAAGHYKLCAYDLITRLLLSYNAARALKSQGVAEGVSAFQTGANISNIFEDIVINTFLIEEGDERNFPQNRKNVCFLYDRFNKLREVDPRWKKFPRKTWDVYMRLLEKIWKEDNRWASDRKKFSDDQEKAAERIYTLLKDDMVNSRNWERRVYRFAQVLSPFLKEDGQQGKDMQMFEKESSGSAKRLQQMVKQMQDKKDQKKQGKKDKKQKGQGQGKDKKDLEQQIKDMQNKVEMEIRGLAKRMNKGGNNRNLMQEYKELTVGSGIVSDETMAERWLYRDLASEYTVKFQPLLRTAGKSHPFTPKVWNVEDPTDKLDIRYTLQTHGIVIPGVTARKWRYAKSKGFREGDNPPDLYIIFDSSGSMINPTSQISPAVVGGMAAAHSALNVGAKVAVMNFSSDLTYTKETTDEDKIDDCLLLYKNGGTDLPLEKDLRGWLKNPDTPKQVLLITDLGFANFDQALPGLKWLLEVNPKNKAAIFCIGGGYQDYGPKLQAVGYESFHVHSAEDLRDIVIGKAQEVYEGQVELTD